MRRRLAWASAGLACALTAGTITAFTAAPIGATANVQTCTVTGTATFVPALTNTAKDTVVTIKGTQKTCSPAAKTGGSGALTATIKLPKFSCIAFDRAGTYHAAATTKWKSKKVSKYSLWIRTSYTLSGANTRGEINATVTSGLFVNHKVRGPIDFTYTNTGCPHPIKSTGFHSKLTIQ